MKSTFIQLPKGKTPTGDTRVPFNTDQTQLLVTYETQIAIYDASNMELLHQWILHDTLSAPLSYASYSCNSQLVYVSFCDGNICIFEADNLRLRCRTALSAYLTPTVANSNPPVYPLVLAVHPQEPNQLAVGLTDGDVKVIEPLDSEGKWGLPVTASIENGAASSATSNPISEQPQR